MWDHYRLVCLNNGSEKLEPREGDNCDQIERNRIKPYQSGWRPSAAKSVDNTSSSRVRFGEIRQRWE